MFKLTIFQSFWDGFLCLTSTKKLGGGSIFCEFLKSLVISFCFVVSMHNPETISDLR